MKLNIKITSVSIITSNGTDKVKIHFDGPTPFPELQALQPGEYNPCFSVETRKGYGVQWVKSLGVPDNLIEVVEIGISYNPITGSIQTKCEVVKSIPLLPETSWPPRYSRRS